MGQSLLIQENIQQIYKEKYKGSLIIMSGVTKRIFGHEIIDIIDMWSNID